ncbi:TlrC/CarA/OleB/SrmB family ABC-F type ribosomal protection protein [Actinomadura harenae]|uniref:TlrC/CarA/OleB/SrmB family ABC-F type ribosomal protection protein n=1 Tax=Actinomadura harenae TaxID=2483351 RepID=A0A3M2MB52_9ACTN|nr:TlrC/CarA/OleB/SrmB family ABC-F type ribosomal protection protein [Actinomadura harenae]RMI46857.1 TlrC/CarA/OleB/SrmB family ABC-F type ribosomal protection protein [Actinomadura harenae]
MRTAQLTLRHVTKRYADRVVLSDVDLTVGPGEKAGVVGDNGSGKSTLLRLLAGRERADNGELTVVADGGVGHLPQTLAMPPRATVRQAIDRALADLRSLEARMRALEERLADDPSLLDLYGDLQERFEARGGYDADARVDVALHGLGLPGLDRDRPLGTLSGGERSRLALAGVLAAAPELLLLDEPTNDLDDQAVSWLEDHLRAHRGTVVAVTHDRVFLDRLTTTVLEVDAGRVVRYGNGYGGYLAAKEAERARRLREYEEWRHEIRRNRGLVTANAARMDSIPRKVDKPGFGHGAFRGRGRAHGAMSRIRNAKERVERLTANPVAPPADPLSFTADVRTAGGDPVAVMGVELTKVRVGARLDVPSLRIGSGERMLVTGPNGAGKSTLLKVLAGELEPDEGTVVRPARIGHLRQDEVPWPPAMSVLRAFAHRRPGDLDEHADTLLSLGLFDASDLGRRVGELSYGQRRRIELARLVAEPADLLLLDEPTNHLSPVLVEELEDALAGYEGALVVVMHDRRMRSRFTGSRLVLEEGRIVSPAG